MSGATILTGPARERELASLATESRDIRRARQARQRARMEREAYLARTESVNG